MVRAEEWMGRSGVRVAGRSGKEGGFGCGGADGGRRNTVGGGSRGGGEVWPRGWQQALAHGEG